MRQARPAAHHPVHRGDLAPYPAVVALAQATTEQWPRLRARMVLAGIHDPLRMLGFHQLLDVVEQLILETMTPEERQKYMRQMYPPPPMPDPDTETPPPGWSRDDEMAAFTDG
ncbi:DUF7240 domain-containing protein [Rhodococcus ruber]